MFGNRLSTIIDMHFPLSKRLTSKVVVFYPYSLNFGIRARST